MKRHAIHVLRKAKSIILAPRSPVPRRVKFGDTNAEPGLMHEATRLTRTGQLVEATALIQRMLRNANSSETTSPCRGRAAKIIDAETIRPEEADRPQLAPATPAQRNMPRRYVRSRKEALRLRIAGASSAPRRLWRTSCRRATQFIEGAYSNPAGSRAYKLFVPSRLSGPTASFGRHAARLYPVAGRFRRGHAG